jgi:hypothetical protein
MGSTLVGDAVDNGFGTSFGTSVALSRDGLTLAVGADWYDGAVGFWTGLRFSTGLVRVFRFVNNDWKKVGQDFEGMAANDYFGSSVAISADGNIVAGGTSTDPGYVQVFSLE